MKHTSHDFVLTLIALLGGGYVAIAHPEHQGLVLPIVTAFVGSWLRALPLVNGDGKT